MKKIWSCIPAQKCIQEAEKGNTEFFSALTEFVTDPNPADVTGWTPLHEAAQSRGRDGSVSPHTGEM